MGTKKSFWSRKPRLIYIGGPCGTKNLNRGIPLKNELQIRTRGRGLIKEKYLENGVTRHMSHVTRHMSHVTRHKHLSF